MAKIQIKTLADIVEELLAVEPRGLTLTQLEERIDASLAGIRASVAGLVEKGKVVSTEKDGREKVFEHISQAGDRLKEQMAVTAALEALGVEPVAIGVKTSTIMHKDLLALLEKLA